jgi:hypothetical protein|tara:strand:+ start:929 stop:1159 length:231 start_codon:yes stop_codon:yes gene_type:complete
MKLPIALIKSVIGSGLKPLPLSGIVKEVKELKQSKFDKEKVLKLAFYVIGGCVVWGVLLGKIDIETAKELFGLFGF